jgi:hypothetical protein
MKTIQIVRVEGKDGRGMFRPEDPEIAALISKNTFISERHCSFKTPFEDGLIMTKDEEWFCAYNDTYDLEQWVRREELTFLICELGFKVLLLTVSKYQVGEHQAIYTKESIVKQDDITEMYRKSK